MSIRLSLISRIVCVVIVFFASYWFLFHKKETSLNEINKVEAYKAKKAFMDAKNALKILSVNINTGIENAQHIKEYDKTKNKVFKQK